MTMIEQVANYAIAKTNESGMPMTNFRLSKTLYLINVEYFKSNGKLLFDDPVTLTDYGTVYRNVYNKYQMHGRRAIPHIDHSDNLKLKNIDMYTISRVVFVCSRHQNSTLLRICMDVAKQNDAGQVFEYLN